MKNLTFLSIYFLLFVQLSLAGNDFNIRTEFPNRKLIVVLQEEDPDDIAEITKSGNSNELLKYKSDIELYNENVKNAFKEFWGDKSIEFLTHTAIEAISNDEMLNNTVLTLDYKEQEGVDFFVFTLKSMYSEINKKGEKKYEINETPFKINIQNEVPSKSDLFYLISNMKIYLGIDKQYDRSGLNDLLSKKTLLINKESCSMSASDIKEEYPYPFKLCTTEEILELAEKNDINYVYFRLGIERRQDKQFVDFIMVDCETGKQLSRCNLSGITKVSINGISEHHKNNDKIEKARRENKIYTGPRGGSFVGEEMARVYTAKAKLKGAQLRLMSSGEKQLKNFSSLMLY